MKSYDQKQDRIRTAFQDYSDDVEMDNMNSENSNGKGWLEKGRIRVQEEVVPVDAEDLSSSNETNERSTKPNTAPTMTIAEPPDGGLRAWLVVIGAMFAIISSFGYIYSWGVFQSYYQQVLLKDNTASAIAWIGSTQSALSLLPTILAGRLLDKGMLKIPFFVSSIFVVGMTLLVGQCTKYWHFLLCQGIVLGFACGMIVGPAISIIPHWFMRKRGTAVGFIAIGSSIGGIVFPIAVRKLIPRIGFPWTMRVVALILLFTLAIPNLTMATRLPPKAHSSGLFDFASFKKPTFAAYGLTTFFAFLGIYTVLTYIDISAVSAGISPDSSFYLVAIANAGSGVGRIAGGYLTDRIGAITVIAPTTFCTGLITFAWPFAKSEKQFTAIAALYGLLSGAYISGFIVPVYMLGETADTGRRLGMFLCIAAVGAVCGPPISGAIYKASGGFEGVGFYAGATTIVASVLMVVSKRLVLGKFWGKY